MTSASIGKHRILIGWNAIDTDGEPIGIVQSIDQSTATAL